MGDFRPRGDPKTGIAVDLLEVRREGGALVAYGALRDGIPGHKERVRFALRGGSTSPRLLYVDPGDFLEGDRLPGRELLRDL